MIREDFFNREINKELVNLTEDSKTVALKKIKDILGAYSFLFDMIKNDSLTEDIRETLLSNVSFNKQEIDMILDKNKDEIKSKMIRENHLRIANERIRELEEKISTDNLKSFDTTMLSDVVRKLSHDINNLWNDKDKGLGGITELNIKEYYAYIRFKPSLSLFSSSFSDTPITDRENKLKWLKSLEEKGLIIKNNYLVFNDFNLEFLENKIKELIPNIKIHSIENNNFDNIFSIKSITGEILFKDLLDVFKNK